MQDNGLRILGLIGAFILIQLVIYPWLGRRWRAADKRKLGSDVRFYVVALLLVAFVVAAAFSCRPSDHPRAACFNPRYDDC